VTTQASATTTKASDVATIAGGGPAPGGTVDFFLCTPAQVTSGGCESGGTQIGVDVAVQADGTATSAMATITQSGKYCWRTVYSGDSFYLGSTDTNTSSECFNPTKQTATLSTTASPKGGNVVPGTSATDTATVGGIAGGPTPGGSVTFFICGPAAVVADSCPIGAGTQVGSAVTLDGNGQASSGAAPDTTAIGEYCWRASYGGDGFYNPAGPTDSANECFTTALQTATIATASSPTGGNVVPGTPAGDSATVTGGSGTPSGSVKFFLCAPSDLTGGSCPSGGTQIGSAVTLGADGKASSASTTGTATSAVGTYCWRAEYSGDGIYASTSDTDSSGECFTVAQQTATVGSTSSPTGGGVVPGTSVSDSATVSGGSGSPTGTVTFFLCGPSDVTVAGCPKNAGSQVGAAKTLSGGQAGSASTTQTTAVGKYCWRVEYSGDTVYSAATGTDATGECFTTATLGTSTSTQASPSGGGIVPGTSASDTATVSNTIAGGSQPNGTVSFFLCAPATVTSNGGDCHAGGSPIGNAVTLVNGQATSSATAATGSIGTYCWRAEYSGDTAHSASTDGSAANECFITVTQPSTTHTQSSSTSSSLPAGSSVSDTATVTGGAGTPTAGTVTFFLCQPATVTANGGDCSSGGSQVGLAKLLNGSGQATSDATSSTTAVGTYCWRAVYSGGGIYDGSSELGTTNECFTTVAVATGADLSITKTAPATVPAGGAFSYTISVHNGGPLQATNVVVTDPLPSSVTFASASASQGSCSNKKGTVTCSVGALANGGTATITIGVKAGTSGQVSNTARVSGSQTDPDASNNSATATTTVAPAADISLSKTVSTRKPAAGAALAYTLTVTNAGPNAASSVVVTDTLPADETFVSASAGCGHSGQIVTCTVANIASGAKASFTLTVQVAAGITSVTNTASVSTTTADPNETNNTVSVTTTLGGKVHGHFIRGRGRHGNGR
jgi:uncharacterized repeat protein (TIGR01451 family)